eukprot:TRINITY_DN6648_c0_g5_i1.p1 TRINITY_DN6648_c0_g5~~TRINITY_DN6648_c0_g5_i1.p1  ORF type:complete len:719 (-),score=134.08 TRINITY_DN6648_c0_g5_i1:115-2271(-)
MSDQIGQQGAPSQSIDVGVLVSQHNAAQASANPVSDNGLLLANSRACYDHVFKALQADRFSVLRCLQSSHEVLLRQVAKDLEALAGQPVAAVPNLVDGDIRNGESKDPFPPLDHENHKGIFGALRSAQPQEPSLVFDCAPAYSAPLVSSPESPRAPVASVLFDWSSNWPSGGDCPDGPRGSRPAPLDENAFIQAPPSGKAEVQEALQAPALNSCSMSGTSQGSPVPQKKPTASPRKSIRSSQVGANGAPKSFRARMRQFVEGAAMEVAFSSLIVLNTITMCIEQQYRGFDYGYEVGYPGHARSSKEVWPQGEQLFEGLEYIFGFVFTFEVIVKLCALRSDFMYSLWNWYDTIIIVFWVVGVLGDLSMAVSPLFLRLARIMRLLRLLRFVRSFQVFDVLHLLVHSLRACLSVLLWSGLFLALIMVASALMIGYSLEPYFTDDKLDEETKLELYRYFGTFTHSVFSMYEVTLGNWVPISRSLIDNISEMWMIFFLGYRTVVGFAVLKVMTGIFIAETFRVASTDDDIMIMQRERQVKTHIKRMTTLLHEADDSQDGCLDMEEFRDILSDSRVQKWLAAQEIEVKDADLVFQMVDFNGDGRLSVEDLVRGFARLKGPAKAMDVVTVVHGANRLESLLVTVDERLQDLERRAHDPAVMTQALLPLSGGSPSASCRGGLSEDRAAPFAKRPTKQRTLLANSVSGKFLQDEQEACERVLSDRPL